MMNFKTYLLILATCVTSVLSGQVNKDQAIVALDQLLNSEANKHFKASLDESMVAISEMSNVSIEDYLELEYTYDVIQKMYNRVYLAEIKLDMTSFRQLKRLGRNPEKQAKKYRNNFFDILDYHENNFIPLYAKLSRLNSPISGDIDPQLRDSLDIELQKESLKSTRVNNISSSINVVSSIFILFEGFSRMIAERKRTRQYLIREFMGEASVIFDETKLPPWESYGIYQPDAYQNDNYQQSTPSYAEERGQAPSSSSSEAPPTDFVGLPNVSGNIHLEMYDASSDSDIYMNLEQSTSRNVNVNDYGESGASFDLKIGRKKSSSSPQKNIDVGHFLTSERYGEGTQFKVQTTGNGFIYIFSINSGDKMFSIHPEVGTAEELPYGTYYPYSENTEYLDGGQMSVSIPGNGDYIEISNPEYGSIPNAETMIVLLSKSQLDIRDLFEKMQNLGPSMSPEERLADIYGTMTASLMQGDVYIDDGVISYYLDDNDPMVLPIVFNVRRK